MSKKIGNNYFVVVVHLTMKGTGEIKTAYLTNYVKKGKRLYQKDQK